MGIPADSTVGGCGSVWDLQTMTKATVKWFNTTKGYGFVVPSEGGQDAYLHISILKQAGYEFLPEGTDVDCDLTEGRKGLQVELIKEVLKMGIGTVTESSEPSDEVQGTV